MPNTFTITPPPFLVVGNPMTFVATASDGTFGDGEIITGTVYDVNSATTEGSFNLVMDGGNVTATGTYTAPTVGGKVISWSTPPDTSSAPSDTSLTAYELATEYTLTPPDPAACAVGQPSGGFIIAIPSDRARPSPTTFTPYVAAAGGTFSPTTITLQAPGEAGAFTFTPTAPAINRTVAANNDGGMNDVTAFFAVVPASGGGGAGHIRTGGAL